MDKKTYQKIENDFKNLSYEYYLYDSWRGLKFKLSPNIFAVKTQFGILNIENKDITKKLWKEFLNFVKSSKPYTLNKPEVATGIVIEGYWRSKLKNFFKKLPDPELTEEYLIKVFKDNGCEINNRNQKEVL